MNETPNPALQHRPYKEKPYWDIERARIGDTREVPLEVIVNGYPVAKQNIAADGRQQEVAFDVKIDRSSWIALRQFPQMHTNPVVVRVAGAPVRGENYFRAEITAGRVGADQSAPVREFD